MPISNNLFYFLKNNMMKFDGHESGNHGKLINDVAKNPHDYGIRGRIENCFKNVMVKDSYLDTHCDIFIKTPEDYYLVKAKTGKLNVEYSDMMNMYRFFRKNFNICPQMIVAFSHNLKYRGNKRYVYFKRPISDLAGVLNKERN